MSKSRGTAVISLTVRRGEFFAVLGPNAAGKTTTIKILTGLIKPTAGTASVAGFDVQAQPLEARRRMAYVPDFPFLYDKLTPWEFMRFTGQIFQMPEEQITRSAAPKARSSRVNSSGQRPGPGHWSPELIGSTGNRDWSARAVAWAA